MARILLLNGPNLNTLGRREPHIYGYDTLDDIVERVEIRAAELGAGLFALQSNHEGTLIDCIQEQGPDCDGLIINAGALTHTSVGLRDAIAGSGLMAVEVHISNVFTREEFRHHSFLSPVCKGMITGLGWQGYIYALEYLISQIDDGAGLGESNVVQFSDLGRPETVESGEGGKL